MFIFTISASVVRGVTLIYPRVDFSPETKNIIVRHVINQISVQSVINVDNMSKVK